MEYAIPAWLEKAVGPPLEPYLLWTDSERFILSRSDLEDTFYGSAEAAYDSTKDAVKLDSSVTKDFGIYFGSSSRYPARMLMSRTDDNVLVSLEEHVFEFIDIHNRRYEYEPNDFMASYNFIDNHVALWTREAALESPRKQYWSPKERVATCTIIPDEKAGHRHFFAELGGTAGPDYRVTYFDPVLSVQASSYEEVIIAAAVKIHQYFWATGELRMNVRADDLEPKDALSESDFEAQLKRLRELRRCNLPEIKDSENPYL